MNQTVHLPGRLQCMRRGLQQYRSREASLGQASAGMLSAYPRATYAAPRARAEVVPDGANPKRRKSESFQRSLSRARVDSDDWRLTIQLYEPTMN